MDIENLVQIGEVALRAHTRDVTPTLFGHALGLIYF